MSQSTTDTTPADEPKKLSPYDIACMPFNEWQREFNKMWQREFNKMNDTARVGMNDVGRRVRYLASDGTIRMGTLTAYDNEHGVGVISPATIMQRYRMRRVDDRPPEIVVKLELNREKADLLMRYLIKSSVEPEDSEDGGQTLRDAMDPYWKMREDIVFEIQRGLQS